ncbi:hypothetical protein [Noviherbaspirillum sp. ST9]|uniref:hypothetical protein n=1 Tax=Noviherbaspirillum sp. ST9 TaxID=3401606 RepID=UPI003B58AE1C
MTPLLTFSGCASGETDKTDKTDEVDELHEIDGTSLEIEKGPVAITNEEFLAAIFGNLSGTARPVVTTIKGNPQKTKAWRCDVYVPGKTAIGTPGQNHYFTMSTFNPGKDGIYRRKKDHFEAIYGVMLDDVGTKAKGRDVLEALPPSYTIETSPGNYQVGYLFAAPVLDKSTVEALVNGLIDGGLCDPGAGGPVTRNGRLPVAVNGKYDPPFACRLVEWHPERKYSLDEIEVGLGLDIAVPVAGQPAKDARAIKKREGGENADCDYQVVTPRAQENAVIAALRQRGLYKSPLGSGKHDITCPWAHEHTDSVDSGTAYWEPDSRYMLGGFKCHHGHCAGRRIGALLAELDVSRVSAKNKPTIWVSAGEINRIVDAAESLLAESGRFYQRGNLLVSVSTDPGTNETVIKAASAQALMRALDGSATWMRFDKRASDWLVCDPPALYVSVLHGATQYPHMPVLNGIARQPYLRMDGSMMVQAGYDPGSGFFGAFDERDFAISNAPTREDAVAALEVILNLLNEFAFATNEDRAAAVSAILTATVRPSLPQAPMFHFKAPQIASGKSYLSALVAAFATPMSVSAASFPHNDEECRKLLLSVLMEGAAVVCFDNLTSDLHAYKSLCSVLTEANITDRILGVNKSATVGTRALFLSSGNNVGPVQDMTRRCITVNLDPRCETPAARTFHGSPVRDVRERRGHFVSLALTIIRAYIVAGSPKTSCKQLASYEVWSDTVRQALLWLGMPDPATSLFAAIGADPDREQLGRVLGAWHELFGQTPKMVRDVVDAISTLLPGPAGDLKEAIDDVLDGDGKINRRRLGKWLARHQGRIVAGLRLEKVESRRNADVWRVVSVSSV